ncbi:hypothetical protein PAWBP_3990 [Paulownia witches'-broom phytoplasma]|nr:hypothetical protein PAWBP_3990 [Paulownia witches'-broom phytoplasma]
MVVDKGADSADVKTKVDQLEKSANDNLNFCGWFRFGYGGESFFRTVSIWNKRRKRTKNKRSKNL